MAGAFDRMSSREKMMVSVLFGLVFVLGIGGYYLYLSSEVSWITICEARSDRPWPSLATNGRSMRIPIPGVAPSW